MPMKGTVTSRKGTVTSRKGVAHSQLLPPRCWGPEWCEQNRRLNSHKPDCSATQAAGMWSPHISEEVSEVSSGP